MISRNIYRVVLTSALTVPFAFVAQVAHAQQVEPGVIQGCYVATGGNPSGNMYRISAPGLKVACSSGDKAVNWNGEGPKGDKGDTGATGATGPTGFTGPQGANGASGATGPAGDKGDTGATGAIGPKGDIGATGAQGAKGDQGIQGLKGDQGIQGEKGDQGIQGLKGDQGIQGLKGDQGDQGIQGLKGDQGIQGEKGETGAQGGPGVKGDKGDTGATGAIGPQGVQGPTGLSGYEQVVGGGSTAQAGQTTRLTVTCPAGKNVLGGGYSNPDAKGTSNTVLASFPASATTWEVQIFNASGSSSFSVRPFAICATVTP